MVVGEYNILWRRRRTDERIYTKRADLQSASFSHLDTLPRNPYFDKDIDLWQADCVKKISFPCLHEIL